MIIHSCYYMKKPSSSPCSNVLPKGCLFSRILRRILCFSAIPWCPFDHHHQQHRLLIKENREVEKKDCNLLMEAAASDGTVAPGLVARLMGLESFPNDRENSGLSRSRQSKGRKVIPTYQKLEEDDKFYTLRFGDKSCRKKRRRRRRRVDQNKENAGTTVIRDSDGNSRIVLQPLMNQSSGYEKDEILNQKLEVVNCSENSSPNSVLEFVEFPPDQTTASACKGERISVSRVGNSKMRRTLSDELESCRNPDHHHQMKKEEMKVEKNRDQRCENSLLRRTGKLAAMEVRRTRWVEEETLEKINLKEIGRDVASDILDNLLNEFLIMVE